MIHMWLKYKLSEIGTIIGGATPSTAVEAYYNGNIPWLTPKDLSDFNGRYIEKGERNISELGLKNCSAQLLPADSVLFSSRAPIGYVAIAKNPIATNQGFKSIIPDKKKINSLFLYYLLKFNKNKIEALGSGTTFKEVSASIMKNVEVCIPSLKEQQQIADILSSFDDKIELNRRINENLEQQAQALFKSWFVDFEPFKNGKFIDSELGKIPEGWRVLCADEIFNINIGKTPPRKENIWFSNSESSNIKWVSISDMGNCETFINSSKEYLTQDAVNQFNIIVVPKNTILLSFKLTIGRVAIAQHELTTNEAIARFYLPYPQFREYTYLTLKSYNYTKLGSTSSIATAVNSKIIKSMKILLPPNEQIKNFSHIAKPIFDIIESLSNEINKLSKIRDTLLPKLISGKLKINNLNI